MPTRAQAKLNRLMAAGLTVVPGLRGLGDAAFTPVPSGKVWGLSGLRGEANGAAAKRRFAAWVRRAYPALYDVAAARAGGTLGIAPLPGAAVSPLDKFIASLSELAPAYLQYQQQRKILDVQLDRARQGLPPLEAAQYAAQVQIGLDPATVRRIADEASTRAGAGLQAMFSAPLLWLAGGGIVLALVMTRRGRPRRRRR